MKKLIFMALPLMLVIGLGSASMAQDRKDSSKEEEDEQPIQEVFQAELVYPQDAGEIQLTLTSRFNRAGEQNGLSNNLTVEYGITDDWQVEVEWDAFARKRTDDGMISRGPGDLQIGTKYSFLKMGGSNFHSAVGFEVTLPSGSVEKGLGEGAIEYEPFVILAKDFPHQHRLQLFTEVSLAFIRPVKSLEPDEQKGNELTWVSGFFVPVRKLVFTGEFSLINSKSNDSGREKEIYLTPGLVWHPAKNWELGVGGQVGLNGLSHNSGVILKLTREWATRKQ
jgi:hypothetical protein